MTKFKFFFLFFFLGLTQSFAQSVPGIISDRVSKLDAMLDEAIKNQQVPGLVAMILKDGKVVYHEAKGFADVPSNRLMKKDDIFRIASQTKAITSTAVMMLWEEGKFRLDDPISMYIPEFKNPQVLSNFRYADTSYTTKPSSKEITIRHLLTHTSGLGYGVIDGDERMRMIYSKAGITDLFTTKNISIEESVKKLAKLPLHHEPGSKYTYSEGLDVLGYFIEVVSGMPFDRFLQERIFDPLGMKDTRFYLSDIQAPRLVTVHTFNQGKWNPYPVTFYNSNYPRKGAKRFFYLNGGVLNGKRILSSHTIETMMKNQVGDLWNGDKFYGLAFGVVTEQGVATGGLGSEGTFDWGGYFNTQYFADPQENIIGLIFKQTSGAGNGDQTGWKFRQMVFTLIE